MTGPTAITRAPMTTANCVADKPTGPWPKMAMVSPPWRLIRFSAPQAVPGEFRGERRVVDQPRFMHAMQIDADETALGSLRRFVNVARMTGDRDGGPSSRSSGHSDEN